MKEQIKLVLSITTLVCSMSINAVDTERTPKATKTTAADWVFEITNKHQKKPIYVTVRQQDVGEPLGHKNHIFNARLATGDKIRNSTVNPSQPVELIITTDDKEIV